MSASPRHHVHKACNDSGKPAKTALAYTPDQQAQANTVAKLTGLPKTAMKE